MGQVPLIKSMSPNVDGRIQVVYGNDNWSTLYRGVTPEFLEIRRWNMRAGEFFTHADVESDAPVCVLGNTVVENLFGTEDPSARPFASILFRAKSSECWRLRASPPLGKIRMTLWSCRIRQSRRESPAPTGSMTFFFLPSRGKRWPRQRSRCTGLLRERHHINPREPEDFNIRRPEDVIQAQLATSKI